MTNSTLASTETERKRIGNPEAPSPGPTSGRDALRGSVLEIGLSSNKCIYVGIGAILILQLGFVYLPFMNVLFGSAPLGLAGWGQALVVGVLVLPVVGLEKALRERRHRRNADPEVRGTGTLGIRR